MTDKQRMIEQAEERVREDRTYVWEWAALMRELMGDESTDESADRYTVQTGEA